MKTKNAAIVNKLNCCLKIAKDKGNCLLLRNELKDILKTLEELPEAMKCSVCGKIIYMPEEVHFSKNYYRNTIAFSCTNPQCITKSEQELGKD
jgi:SpoU rRNA methylase family enzyme